MNAKYYIYFNLHKHCFSIKHQGKVILHASELTIHNGSFKVNQAGRLRVVAEKRKNVHAFIVSDNYVPWISVLPHNAIRRVTYNPYVFDSFVVEDTERLLFPIKNSNTIICRVENGKPVIMAE